MFPIVQNPVRYFGFKILIKKKKKFFRKINVLIRNLRIKNKYYIKLIDVNTYLLFC